MRQLYPPAYLVFLHSFEDLLVLQPITISKAKYINKINVNIKIINNKLDKSKKGCNIVENIMLVIKKNW